MSGRNFLSAFLIAAAAAGVVLLAYEVDRRWESAGARSPASIAEAAGEQLSPAPLLEKARRRLQSREALVSKDVYVILLVIVATGAWFRLIAIAQELNPKHEWGPFNLFRNVLGLVIFVAANLRRTLPTLLLLFGSLGAAAWLRFLA